MNMIAGSKVSIVDPTPGVTRDRVAAIVHLKHPDNQGPAKAVEFVDTGGFGVYVAEGARYDEIGADLATLTDSIENQIAQAVTNADVILLAIDCQQGLTPADEEIARLLREQRLGPGAKKHGKVVGVADTHKRAPVLVVGTKCDGPKWEAHALELASLGFGEPLMCSSKSNYFRREFLDAIYNTVPAATAEESKTAYADLKMAIIGKRNAGKSTLVNTLAGEPRMIVSEIAGTTRDAVDVRFEMDGRTLIAIDTAGLRRKRSFQNMVEHYAYDRAVMAIDRADVVVLLIDAIDKISQVDEQLAGLCQRSYKPVIIAINKWDLAEGRTDDRGRPASPDRYEEYLRKDLRALPFAPIAFVSGETGRNVRAMVNVAFDLHDQSRQRVTKVLEWYRDELGTMFDRIEACPATRSHGNQLPDAQVRAVFACAGQGSLPTEVTFLLQYLTEPVSWEENGGTVSSARPIEVQWLHVNSVGDDNVPWQATVTRCRRGQTLEPVLTIE